MSSVPTLLAQALGHHRNGDLSAAEPLYRRILQADSSNADANHLLGVLLHQQGHPVDALEYLQAAAESAPSNGVFLFDLANALSDTGEHDQAAKCYERATKAKPDLLDAYVRWGNCLRVLGDLRAAIRPFRQALKRKPDLFVVRCNLGGALKQLGEFPEAEKHLREALRIEPDSPEALSNLGLVLLEQGNTDEAVSTLNRASTIRPDNAEIHNNLGNALLRKAEIAEAEKHLEEALSLNPRYAEAHVNLGNLRLEKRDFDGAQESYRQGLRLKPDYADGYYNLGNLMRETSNLDQAVECFEKTLTYKPNHLAALTNLGETLQVMGELDTAEEYLNTALAADQSCQLAHDNLLACMNYNPRYSPTQIAKKHRRWGASCAPRLKPRPFPNVTDPHRPLRIGYVSPDFCKHPAGSFLLPLVSAHDSSSFEVYCYSQVKRADEKTRAFQNSAAHWRDTVSLSEGQVEEMIRNDNIDILVDCAGHTAGNRLAVFSRRPAPVQATYLGYPNTTGLAAIDFFLTDSICDPEGQDELYTEEVFRLDRCFCCYGPPEDAPEVSELPANRDGSVTFGSLHNLARLNEEVISLWSQLLRAVPTSRLLIFRTTLSSRSEDRIRSWFAGNDIDTERLLLVREVSGDEGYLAAYHSIDIALDTFPWSGHTTACEGMWMGVPMITLAGDRHAGRMVASVLGTMGLDELVSHDPAEYVSIAAILAGDTKRLSELRGGLRQRMLQSPLCDGRQLAQQVESAYRIMWERWCSKQ